MDRRRRYNFLFRTYRAALKGDLLSAQFLVDLFVMFLESDKVPPPGLKRFFLSKLKDPEEFYRIRKFKLGKKRGRPSIDDGGILDTVGFRVKRHLGSKPSEKNAMMVAYLVSQGYSVNELGSDGSESAVDILSQLTGRSVRSLQSDYYKHRVSFEGRGFALSLGKTHFESKIALQKIRNKYRKSSR